jgi:hypothetical protein
MALAKNSLREIRIVLTRTSLGEMPRAITRISYAGLIGKSQKKLWEDEKIMRKKIRAPS